MAISLGQSVNPPGVGYPGNWPGSDDGLFIGNNTGYYNYDYGWFTSGKFGDVNGSTNGYSSPAGYLNSTNGYLYQWGTATVGSTPSNSYIAFPTSYYGTFVQVWITFGAAYAYPQSAYGGAPYSACARLGPNSISSSGFYYSCIVIDPEEGLLPSGLAYGAGSSTIYWMAVGY